MPDSIKNMIPHNTCRDALTPSHIISARTASAPNSFSVFYYYFDNIQCCVIYLFNINLLWINIDPIIRMPQITISTCGYHDVSHVFSHHVIQSKLDVYFAYSTTICLWMKLNLWYWHLQWSKCGLDLLTESFVSYATFSFLI